MCKLLMPREVDRMLRYPRGRSARLAKERKIVCIILPDGEIRFDEAEIIRLLQSQQQLPAHIPTIEVAVV